MANITLQGNTTTTNGELPEIGSNIPDFVLVNKDMANVSLKDFSGKKKLLNIFPSIDTPVCAASTRKFNQQAASRENTVVLAVSADLPFAHARFCGAEGIESVQSLSTMRGDFAEDYGVKIVDGPLAGLNARAVIVTDENDNVIYTQMVSEISDEPDYEAALAALD